MAVQAFNHYVFQNLNSRGLIFDSVYRLLRPVVQGIDSPEVYSHIWFSFKPYSWRTCLHAASTPQAMVVETENFPIEKFPEVINRWKYTFSLQILSEESNQNSGTTALLSKHLIRRYIDRYPISIGIIHISTNFSIQREQMKIVNTSMGDTTIKIQSISSDSIRDKSINEWLREFCRQYYSVDLIFLKFGAESVDKFIDNCIVEGLIELFIPAYPVQINENFFIMTPIQILQFNGCRDCCGEDVRTIFRSLIARISITIGAILVAQESTSDQTIANKNEITKDLIHDNDREWHLHGMHAVRKEKWIADGRMVWILKAKAAEESILKANGSEKYPVRDGTGFIGRHVTYCNHGWCR